MQVKCGGHRPPCRRSHEVTNGRFVTRSALLLEQNDGWAQQRRYMTLKTLAEVGDNPTSVCPLWQPDTRSCQTGADDLPNPSYTTPPGHDRETRGRPPCLSGGFREVWMPGLSPLFQFAGWRSCHSPSPDDPTASDRRIAARFHSSGHRPVRPTAGRRPYAKVEFPGFSGDLCLVARSWPRSHQG